MSFAEGLDAGSLAAGAGYLSRPAEEYVNDETVEVMWATKAVEFAEIHFNLISSVDPKLLKLTKKDDDRIYDTFKEQFPNFNLQNVSTESLKSDNSKELWRYFCNLLKDIEDYSYGTLLRLNSNDEYSNENTIIVTRIQFLAIEIARNREGYNNEIYKENSFVPPTKSSD